MRAYLGASVVVLCMCSMLTASADPAAVDPADLDGLFKTLQAGNATEPPRLLQWDSGFVRFAGAPPGGQFAAPAAVPKSAGAEGLALSFVTTHAGAFAAPCAAFGFEKKRVTQAGGRAYVRMQQKYGALRVFGAEILVQIDNAGGIACVLSDLMQDPALLENGAIALTPTIPAQQAQQAATAWAARTYGASQAGLQASEPELLIYEPSVVGAPGETHLAWRMAVLDVNSFAVAEMVFVDAHSAEVIFNYPLVHNAKFREIYDGQNTPHSIVDPLEYIGTLVRAEGDPPSGIRDADVAYDFLGDTYDFYHTVHGRDSIDDNGLVLSATVRFCESYTDCPYENAFYWPREELFDATPYEVLFDRMYFGEGMIADDVTAHELTHGVTSYESELIYAYQSGAINESFSDIWGEYVDLTNGKGTDTEDLRWYMGEDTPLGAIRNMADPPEFGLPDRLGSPYYYTGFMDNGGVHTNMGVGSKLCYLLTDGDEFNGETVEGMGIEQTAKLFYELQTNLLTPASGWYDLYMQLGQATINLDYSFDEQLNVLAACRAVEIVPPSEEGKLGGFRAVPTFNQTTGDPVIALYWTNPLPEDFRRVILVRDTETFPASPTVGEEVYRGREDRFLDSDVVSETRYFYTLFLEPMQGFPELLNAQAVAGGDPPDYLTEAFWSGWYYQELPQQPIDLAYSQILFAPTGAPLSGLDEPPLPTDHSYYTAAIKRGVYELPVPREDTEGRGFDVAMAEDGGVTYGSAIAPFPFFGKKYSTVHLGANGYVAFRDIREVTENFPSLAAHFAVPRISFLFADLSPKTSGNIWARELDDRLVATFENVAERGAFESWPSAATNTIQIELFYSGHIRITYLQVNVTEAVCGLSDGLGAPQDPADLFENVRSVDLSSDLSRLPAELSALTIAPLPPLVGDAGEVLAFDVQANIPQGTGLVALSAQWDRAGAVPFGDNYDGTGAFYWRTGWEDYGQYVVRVLANAAASAAYQDVVLWVGEVELLPIASNLRLRSSNPVEDPTRSRPVSVESALFAEYDYSHPQEADDPTTYAEGYSTILWFKNNSLIPAFMNQNSIPPQATKANERWFFTVTPATMWGVEGKRRQSPIITIMALPEVLNVALPNDLPEVVTPGDLPLAGLPLASGPATGGTTAVILGRRLSAPMSVKIGGVEVRSIKSVSDSRIEVLTPAHVPCPIVGGLVLPEDIVVTTAAGSGLLQEAFSFINMAASFGKADINRDGRIDAVDVQLVVNALLEVAKSASYNTDVNRDGKVDSADVQVVVNAALRQ